MDEVIPNKLELDWNIDGLKTWSTYCSEQRKSKGRRRSATRDILHSSDVTNLLRGSQLGKSTVQPYESTNDEDDSEDDFIYNDNDCNYESDYISSDYDSDDDMEMKLQDLIRDTKSTQDVNSSTFLQDVL